MKTNILDYLEEQVKKMPEKIVFEEETRGITYRQFQQEAKQVGCNILERGITKGRVAVYLDKGIDCLVSMFGILYSSGVYCVLDTKSPLERVASMLETLSLKLIITDARNFAKIGEYSEIDAEYLLLENVKEQEINNSLLYRALDNCIDTDPAYIIFTSGSTGIPKGAIVSHRAVISYTETIVETFELNSDVIFGSQTPFYFSSSVLDIFTTVATGGTLVIIPKMCFSFPVRLIEFLNAHKVNTIYWVPTAMSIVANRNTFSAVVPEHLTRVMFVGEVMPVKQLNYWIKYLSGCLFANLYGPAEITDTGTYYIVNRTFSDEESLPIGLPFKNCDVILLNDKNELAGDNEEGEICFRGSFLGYGYYDNWKKTQEVFCQNPLNKNYPEIIYRTGDIGKYNEYGEILYISRKDFQIKRMGYRIELGEIESNAAAVSEIYNCACIYDAESMKLILYYVGNIEEEEVADILQKKLAKYMQPDFIFKLKSIPINANGKYDRQLLGKKYREERG